MCTDSECRRRIMDTNQALINFIYAALFDRPVSKSAIQADLSAILPVAKKNSVASVVYKGIQKSGLSLEEPTRSRYQEEVDKTLFTYLMQSQQADALSEKFEKAQIPFVLLKGSRMRDFYPSAELRTSGDIDILVRADDKTLRQLMEDAGFCYDGDDGNTLNFTFGSAVKIELHRNLFDDKLSFQSYFDSIWDRVQPKTGWNYRFVMTEEDFYVNMIAHFAKHFSRYGCGIRNAIDVAVYLKNAPEDFDRNKAETILRQLGLYDFEQKLLELISSWETDIWSNEVKALTDYILGCGLFGSTKTRTAHTISNSLDKQARKKSLMLHFFPDFRTMSNLYPVLKKCPVLLPLCWIARCFRLAFCDRKKVKNTLALHSQIDEQSLSEVNNMLQKMHLQNFGIR